MRTTLNLDADIASQLAERARGEGRSLSRVANDLMRIGLRGERAERAALAPYEPPVFDSGRSTVDLTDVAQALERADELG